jgi:hypothetical protein
VEREELRGLLNAGYRRGAVAHRMGGAVNPTPKPSPFTPERRRDRRLRLPDTITDRLIPIRLKAGRATEQVRRFLAPETPEHQGAELRDRLDWLEPQLASDASAPSWPDELDAENTTSGSHCSGSPDLDCGTGPRPRRVFHWR